MKDKNNIHDYNDFSETTNYGEFKEHKIIFSKADTELFDDAKAVPLSVVRIKRMGSSNKNEKWRIIENDELKFVIDGTKLNKKECSFLRTIDGVKFLIAEFKLGFKSLHELRGRLKTKV